MDQALKRASEQAFYNTSLFTLRDLFVTNSTCEANPDGAELAIKIGLVFPFVLA